VAGTLGSIPRRVSDPRKHSKLRSGPREPSGVFVLGRRPSLCPASKKERAVRLVGGLPFLVITSPWWSSHTRRRARCRCSGASKSLRPAVCNYTRFIFGVGFGFGLNPSRPSGLIEFTALWPGVGGARDQALLGCRRATSPRSMSPAFSLPANAKKRGQKNLSSPAFSVIA
jgi:hypothetical protein